MYTPLANAGQLFSADGSTAAEHAGQFHEAALMTTIDR